MIQNKYGIFIACCVVCMTASANSWDKFVSVKSSSKKEAAPAVVSPAPVVPQKTETSYNKYVTKKEPLTTNKAPQQPVEKIIDQSPTVCEHSNVVVPQVSESTYKPEIVPPYEMDISPAPSAPIQQQTYQQAQQQLQQQQSHYRQPEENQYTQDVVYDENYSDEYAKAYSQWFDNDIRPVFYLRGGLIDETEFVGYGATEIALAEMKARLFKVVDFLPGASFDTWLFADGMYFIDNPGMSVLPDSLLAAGLDMGLWWRFTNGFSWEFRGAPGIYSDAAAPAFSCTGTLNLHYTMTDKFCLVLGATYRPEWDMEIFPNVGFIWQPSELVRIHAALPESRVDLFPRHVFNFFATFAWDNTTYWLDESESLLETVTFDAYRASVGATITLFDELELTAEIGTHLKHELKGDVKGEETVELDETTFIRATIGNSF